MMPFLYQTRTISGLHRFICNRRYRNRRYRNRILPSIHRTSFHTSLPRATHEIEDEINYDEDNTDSQIQSKHGRSITYNLFPEDDVLDNFNIKKSQLDLEGNVAQPVGIDFEENDQTLVNHGTEIDALASPEYPKRESTITDSERHTFNRIFKDISSRTQMTSLNNYDGDDDDGTQNLSLGNKENARNMLDNIMVNSLSRRHRTKEQRKAEIDRYPPALRAAAARAIGLYPEDELEPEIEAPELGSDAQEQLRIPVRERVEGFMRKANTDFELWGVLEKEVFPLVGKMGLAETREARTHQRQEKHKSRLPSLAEDLFMEEDGFPVTGVDPEISPLALYGPLYPSYLLLALRLLDRGFHKPSQLSACILPRIKSFGLLSHVLGASTPLYNELLRIYWLRSDDFRTCIDLLKEMEHAGLEFDSETLKIVTDILRVRAIVWKGGAGRNKAALWSLPEFKKSRHLEVWHDKISRALGEKRIRESE